MLWQYQLDGDQALLLNEALGSLSKILKLHPEIDEEVDITLEDVSRINKILENQHPLDEIVKREL